MVVGSVSSDDRGRQCGRDRHYPWSLQWQIAARVANQGVNNCGLVMNPLLMTIAHFASRYSRNSGQRCSTHGSHDRYLPAEMALVSQGGSKAARYGHF